MADVERCPNASSGKNDCNAKHPMFTQMSRFVAASACARRRRRGEEKEHSCVVALHSGTPSNAIA